MILDIFLDQFMWSKLEGGDKIVFNIFAELKEKVKSGKARAPLNFNLIQEAQNRDSSVDFDRRYKLMNELSRGGTDTHNHKEVLRRQIENHCGGHDLRKDDFFGQPGMSLEIFGGNYYLGCEQSHSVSVQKANEDAKERFLKSIEQNIDELRSLNFEDRIAWCFKYIFEPELNDPWLYTEYFVQKQNILKKGLNNIPIFDIFSFLFAFAAGEGKMGEKYKFRGSDRMDLILISLGLPYYDVMVIDNNWAEKVNTKHKNVSLADKYSCKVFGGSRLELERCYEYIRNV